MDEEMMQMAALEQMMGGGGAPAMDGGMGDPFASEAPPGYSMVMVPDAVLPAVMELVAQAEGGAMGASGATPGGAEMGGMPLM